MDFAHGSEALPVFETHLRAISKWIPWRAFQPNAQAWFGVDIPEQASLRGILGHDQVNATISVEVGDCRPPLFAVDQNTAFPTRQSTQPAPTITLQPQAPTGIISRGL